MTQLDMISAGAVTEDWWQKEPKLMRAPNGYELAARLLLGKDDRWELYAWNVLGSDVVEVTGAIPVRKSPDGRRVWPKGKGDVVVVSDAKLQAALSRWESQNGSCAGCGGDGLQLAAWSRDRGYRYRTCGRCGGSGKPKGSKP